MESVLSRLVRFFQGKGTYYAWQAWLTCKLQVFEWPECHVIHIRIYLLHMKQLDFKGKNLSQLENQFAMLNSRIDEDKT